MFNFSFTKIDSRFPQISGLSEKTGFPFTHFAGNSDKKLQSGF